MSRPFTSPLAQSLYGSPQQVTTPPQKRSSEPYNTQSPSTPVSRYPSPLPKPSQSREQTPTGKWSHPAIAKVTLLEARKAPNDTTLRRIFYNLGALFLSHKAAPYLRAIAYTHGIAATKYTNWTVYVIYALLCYNIFESMRRFWWTNAYNDPTLTAKQRHLLNLPPAAPVSASAADATHHITPSIAAITPPKYSKTFTPSPVSQSPLSAGGRRASYTPTTNKDEPQSIGQSPFARAFGSPSTRHVSMLVPSPTHHTLTTESSSSLPIMASPASPKSEFQGSSRWRYSQSVSHL